MTSGYIEYLVAKKCSKNTIAAYTKAIDDCMKFIGKSESEVTALDLTKWIASISHLSSATVAQKISAIKSYFKFLKMYGEIESNPAIEIESPSIKNKVKQYMSKEDIKAMIDNARNVRDVAVILTYATTGMRFSELESITLAEWHEMISNGVNYIKILGKGSKERNVYFNQQTIDAIERYLRNRHIASKWLFASNEGNQIARQNMSNMLKTTARRAGIVFADDISNHAMRAACASIMSENGVPVAVIRDTLGHSSIAVTSRYIKTSEKAINNANATMTF